MTTELRKMVTLRTIDDIRPIPDADRIVEARIGGWSVVVKKDEFQPGDLGVFFEIDSALPLDNPLFAFLAERGVKTLEEREVHVVKTARLRGVFSQGLLLPYDDKRVQEQFAAHGFETTLQTKATVVESMCGNVDFSDVFGVVKYEAPLPTDGSVAGEFPQEARRTDAERVQNIPESVYSSLDVDDWYATEKIDGESTTFVKRDGEIVAASRRWALHENSRQGKLAKELNLVEIMPEGAVLQGEFFGEGSQKNPLRIQGTRFAVFSYVLPEGVAEDVQKRFLQFVEQYRVPMLDWKLPATVEEAVQQVNGMKSIVNPKVQAEGVVWWNKHGEVFRELGYRPNFKAINNKFLLKNDR